MAPPNPGFDGHPGGPPAVGLIPSQRITQGGPQKKGREILPGPFSQVKQQVVQKALLTLTKNRFWAMSEEEVPLDRLRKFL